MTRTTAYHFYVVYFFLIAIVLSLLFFYGELYDTQAQLRQLNKRSADMQNQIRLGHKNLGRLIISMDSQQEF
jgi:hypothetical protein